MEKKIFYICSPSMPYNKKKYPIKAGIKMLNNLGFDVSFAKHAFNDNGNVSSSIKNRIEDIHEGFTNPKYDIIMASCGGWNSNELLPYLNLELIKKNPKKLIGMSDITTLCINLWQKANITTYYGMMFRNLTLSNNYRNYFEFKSIINDSNKFKGFLKQEVNKKNVFRHGKMTGKLIGGNLAVICWLIGTPYNLKVLQNSILFLEDDVETTGYYWQMYLTHLKQSGVFNKIKGLVIGKVLPETKFNKKSDFFSILNNAIKEYKFPVLIDGDFGHIDFPLTIPYGIEYELDI